MSRFLQTLLGSAAESGCGITTGEPAAPARRTWGEVHAEARRTMGALVADGLAPGDAVAVLAGEPAPSRRRYRVCGSRAAASPCSISRRRASSSRRGRRTPSPS